MQGASRPWQHPAILRSPLLGLEGRGGHPIGLLTSLP